MNESKPRTVGEWIRLRRTEMGMTQRHAAEVMGVHQSTLSDIERGLSARLTREQIEAFAAAAAISPDDGLTLAGYGFSTSTDAVPADLLDLCRKFQTLPTEMREAIRRMIEAATAAA